MKKTNVDRIKELQDRAGIKIIREYSLSDADIVLRLDMLADIIFDLQSHISTNSNLSTEDKEVLLDLVNRASEIIDDLEKNNY